MTQPARNPFPDAQPDELCGISVIDLPKVRRVSKALESADVLAWAAEVLKALADPTRLKIVRSLMLEDRLCVCDLAALAGVSQSGVSHQLRLLRSCRLVRAQREGKMVYYRLDDEHVAQIVRVMLDHVQHD
jgi:ArsR family transcriptional regulator